MMSEHFEIHPKWHFIYFYSNNQGKINECDAIEVQVLNNDSIYEKLQ